MDIILKICMEHLIIIRIDYYVQYLSVKLHTRVIIVKKLLMLHFYVDKVIITHITRKV